MLHSCCMTHRKCQDVFWFITIYSSTFVVQYISPASLCWRAVYGNVRTLQYTNRLSRVIPHLLEHGKYSPAARCIFNLYLNTASFNFRPHLSLTICGILSGDLERSLNSMASVWFWVFGFERFSYCSLGHLWRRFGSIADIFRLNELTQFSIRNTVILNFLGCDSKIDKFMLNKLCIGRACIYGNHSCDRCFGCKVHDSTPHSA